MARAKMIKEVEVKFSPAFDKAINGVKTTKKATKPKTKKATAKPKKVTKAKTKTIKPKAVKPAANKAPRGYKIEKVERELTLDNTKAVYELYEVTGKKLPEVKRFVSYEHAVKFIGTLENEILQTKALAGKVHGGPMARAVIVEQRELAAAADLPELDTDRPERCDKTSIEDIDA